MFSNQSRFEGMFKNGKKDGSSSAAPDSHSSLPHLDVRFPCRILYGSVSGSLEA